MRLWRTRLVLVSGKAADMRDVMNEREQIEALHQEYRSLRENTPMMQRDGEECKAYHKWYDSAYIYFKSFPSLRDDPDFKVFVDAEKEGNCFPS